MLDLEMGQKDYWCPSERLPRLIPFSDSAGKEESGPLLGVLFPVDQGVLGSIRVDVYGKDSCLIGNPYMYFVLLRGKMKRLKRQNSQ